jgi:hypothetical protein
MDEGAGPPSSSRSPPKEGIKYMDCTLVNAFTSFHLLECFFEGDNWQGFELQHVVLVVSQPVEGMGCWLWFFLLVALLVNSIFAIII